MPPIGKLSRYQAQHWGMEVDEVSNGLAALEALQTAWEQQQRYDVAILDMQMPEMDGEKLGQLISGNADFQGLPLVMMTSMNLSNAQERMKQSGFADYLVKPVKESRLQECLTRVLQSQELSSTSETSQGNFLDNGQRSVTGSDRSGNPPLARWRSKGGEPVKIQNDDSKDSKEIFQQKILIVEDNAINQKVLRHQLKRLGYEKITIAANGQEALDLLDTMTYDLVLMDCQMPVLDGYRATELIRQREGDYQHTVIIAMTAHAMKGDREKCLAAGMDDYLTKPIDVEQLSTTLKHWSNVEVKQSSHDRVGVRSPNPQPKFKDDELLTSDENNMINNLTDVREAINFDRLEEISGGDLEFQQELLQAFLEDFQFLKDQIQQEIAIEDFLGIKQHAHTLKGASSNVGFTLIQETALTLEKKAVNKEDISTFEPLLQKLDKGLIFLENFLSKQFS
jgi:CheY-like chemotaxis protein